MNLTEMTQKVTLILIACLVMLVRGDSWQTCLPTDYRAVISAQSINSMFLDVIVDDAEGEEYFFIGANVVHDDQDMTFLYTFQDSQGECELKHMLSYESEGREIAAIKAHQYYLWVYSVPKDSKREPMVMRFSRLDNEMEDVKTILISDLAF